MKLKLSIIITCILYCISMAENSVILEQKGSPIKIDVYISSFQKESTNSYDSHPDRISHNVGFSNISDKIIVAYQIAFASFDTFNNFMSKFLGYSIEKLDVKEIKNLDWVDSPYEAFAFKEYGTSVAYVNAVRFSDGTIWKADIQEILEGLQKFENDLKKEDLQVKKK